jgi:hypothetical protein
MRKRVTRCRGANGQARARAAKPCTLQDSSPGRGLGPLYRRERRHKNRWAGLLGRGFRSLEKVGLFRLGHVPECIRRSGLGSVGSQDYGSVTDDGFWAGCNMLTIPPARLAAELGQSLIALKGR